MSEPKVLVVGNNTIDLVFVCERLPSVGEKCQVNEFRSIAGGQAANVAVALRGLGVPVEYVGCFGDDSYGEMSRQSLVSCGIDVSRCIVRQHCPNHLASIVVSSSDSERTIVMYKDPRIIADVFEPDSSWLDGIGLVYTDGHEPMFSRKLGSLTRREGIPMLADAEKAEGVQMLLADLSSLIAPEKVILELTGEASLEDALQHTVSSGLAVVIATMGENGAVGFSPRLGVIKTPAFKCDVRDTTGAGDAFHAGYIAAVFRGASMEDAMRQAARVASAACECLGPRVDFALLRERGLVTDNQLLMPPQRGIWI